MPRPRPRIRPAAASQARHLLSLGIRLARAQRSLRILDSFRWCPAVEQAFHAAGGREQPRITADYYRDRPLPFAAESKLLELADLERDVRRSLGARCAAGRLLLRRCREYQEVCRLIVARGTPGFAARSRDLYGTTLCRTRAGAPTSAAALRHVIGQWPVVNTRVGDAEISAECAAMELSQRFSARFGPATTVRVCISDDALAEAVADGTQLKLRTDARFRREALDLLEVHEGWVHLGTTLNGRSQPACSFLSKGPPSCARSQEGLAVLMEFLAGVTYPERVRRIGRRLDAVAAAERGADFRALYRRALVDGDSPRAAYQQAARVFRGSLPAGAGPFTKDLCYGQGVALVWRAVRAAVAAGRAADLALLFSGKVACEELDDLAELRDLGLLAEPRFVPPPFDDPAHLVQRLEELAPPLAGAVL